MSTITIVLIICLALAVALDILLIIRVSVLRKMLSFLNSKLVEIEKRLLSQPKNGDPHESENGTNT